MKIIEQIALGLCLGLLVSVAMAHEGHSSEPAPAIVAPPATGTHDALTWFTDTPLVDQNGQTLRFYSDVLKNRVVLLNVIFTHCTDACPLITRKLTEVRQAMGKTLANEVYFISLSSDPARDTPEALKAFAQKQGAVDPHWLFLTGTKEQIDLVMSRLGHLLPSPEQHSTQIIVGDVANKRWSRVRPDAPPAAIAQRLQLLTLPVAGR